MGLKMKKKEEIKPVFSHKVIIQKRIEDISTSKNIGNLCGCGSSCKDEKQEETKKTSYKFDISNIKMVKPENQKVAEAQSWIKKNLSRDTYKIYEQGITNDTCVTIIHYALFLDSIQADEFDKLFGFKEE